MNAEESISLWDTLIAMDTGFRIAYFRWLCENECSNEDGKMALFIDRICPYFQHKPWDVDVYDAFRCFKSLFLSINSKKKLLSLKTEHRRDNYDLVKHVIDIDGLVGVDTFWNILSYHVSSTDVNPESRDKTVRSCMRLYTHLLIRIENIDDKKKSGLNSSIHV